MKILYHHRTQRKGVEGIHVSNVINALRKSGCQVIEVALIKESKKADNRKTNNVSQNFLHLIALHAPDIVFRFLEILYNLLALYKITKFINPNH